MADAQVLSKLSISSRQFQAACDQVQLINSRLTDLQIRLHRAQKNRSSSQHSLKLQMSVVEGVRNMMIEYASYKSDHMTFLIGHLYGQEEEIDMYQ